MSRIDQMGKRILEEMRVELNLIPIASIPIIVIGHQTYRGEQDEETNNDRPDRALHGIGGSRGAEVQDGCM